MFTILDSCDVRQVAVTRYPFRSLRLPNALTDKQALRSSLFPLTGAEGVRLLLRLLWATECVGCPHKQGRTGDHFPVGSNPLQMDSPEDVSAKHRLSLACFQLTVPFRGMLLTS